MKHLTVSFFITLISCSWAQTDSLLAHEEYSPRKNSFYLEIAGDGALFSLNYDRLLLFKNKHSLIGRAGFGFLFNIVLVEATYALGKKHCIEHGVSYGHDLSGHWLMHYRLGYRYRGDKGLLIRAAPLIQYNKFSGNPSPIGFWYGVSIGYSF